MDIRPASADDAAVILELRHAAEDWLLEREIDQWRPREVPLAAIEQQVADGEFFVVSSAASNTTVGALRLLWSDPEFWGDDDGRAAYVHGLVIDRRFAGRGLGRDMLTWAEHRARDAGAAVLRLDCAATNLALRRYYVNFGFTEVGERHFEQFSVTLLEKPVGLG